MVAAVKGWRASVSFQRLLRFPPNCSQIIPTGSDVPNGYTAVLVNNAALMVCTLHSSKVFLLR